MLGWLSALTSWLGSLLQLIDQGIKTLWRLTVNKLYLLIAPVGRIVKEGRKVHIIERIVIYSALALALWFAFRKPAPVVVSAPVIQSVSESPKVEVPDDGFSRNAQGEIYELLPISWFSSGRFVRCYLGGDLVAVGSVTPRGVVQSVSPSVVKFLDFDGSVRWVYHHVSALKDLVSASPKNGQSS